MYKQVFFGIGFDKVLMIQKHTDRIHVTILTSLTFSMTRFYATGMMIFKQSGPTPNIHTQRPRCNYKDFDFLCTELTHPHRHIFLSISLYMFYEFFIYAPFFSQKLYYRLTLFSNALLKESGHCLGAKLIPSTL